MPRKKKVDDELPVPRSKNPFVTTLVVLVGLFFLSSMFAGLAGFSGSDSFSGNVAVIPVKGLIMGDGGNSLFVDESVAASSRIVSQLEKAAGDDRVKAVVLEINSGGGSAVASSEVAEAVARLDKPVVAWVREIGASGAYWIATSADHIVAHELSITGSIGVQGSYLEFGGLLEEYNITYQRMVAGEYKDAGSPLRELKPDEESMLQSKLDFMHGVFIREVAKNRNLSVAQVEPFADGFFLLGAEALDAGLVDQLGGRQEVVGYLQEVLNESVELSWMVTEKSLVEVLGGLQKEHGLAVGRGFATGLRDQSIRIRT